MQSRKKKSLTSYSSIPEVEKKNKKGPSHFRLFIGFSLIILFAIGGAYSYFKTIKSMEFTPQKVFEEGFADPLASVRDLTGDSKPGIGFDSWIRFKSETEMHLKMASEFKPALADVGRSFFAEKYPGDRILKEPPASYEYLVRNDHQIGRSINEALLIHKKDHEYFYHISGM